MSKKPKISAFIKKSDVGKTFVAMGDRKAVIETYEKINSDDKFVFGGKIDGNGSRGGFRDLYWWDDHGTEIQEKHRDTKVNSLLRKFTKPKKKPRKTLNVHVPSTIVPEIGSKGRSLPARPFLKPIKPGKLNITLNGRQMAEVVKEMMKTDKVVSVPQPSGDCINAQMVADLVLVIGLLEVLFDKGSLPEIENVKARLNKLITENAS